jgi:uncharacterized protein
MAGVEAPVAEKPSASRAHRFYFAFAFSWIARFLNLRNRLFGWDKSGRAPEGIHERSSRHSIVSGASRLDAIFVEPTSRPAVAALLLCHGIAETVEQWFGVQQILAANGVASLAFDYSGYGKSAGRPDWDQFELDAIASFDLLHQLAPDLPLSVLGFSLGSGVAVATINRVRAERLILCEAFTSFRVAAHSFLIPKALSSLVPPIWHAEEQLCNCKLPVLIVHGEKDRLFPFQMATDLAAFCSPNAEVVLVPDTTHNQPFRKPHISYWGPIISHITGG